MAQPTLKQRKTFALIRIFGGMVAALYLSFVVVSNVLAGVPFGTPGSTNVLHVATVRGDELKGRDETPSLPA